MCELFAYKKGELISIYVIIRIHTTKYHVRKIQKKSIYRRRCGRPTNRVLQKFGYLHKGRVIVVYPLAAVHVAFLGLSIYTCRESIKGY